MTVNRLFMIPILGLLVAGCSDIQTTQPVRIPTLIPTLSETPFSPIPNTDTATPVPPTVTPTPTPTPTIPACLSGEGRIEVGSLESEILSKPLEYRVYLPRCYAELPQEYYPVLYMVHGSTYTDDQWDRLGIDETADQLILNGQIPPLMIVMPRDRVWTEPDEDPFGDAVLEELIPFIDTQYRTVADRQHRAVGGLSRGAAWAVHLGISRWDLFGSIGAHSMVFFKYDINRMRAWLKEIPTDQQPRILIDDGKGDRYIEQAYLWRRMLLDGGYVLDWRLYEGYHNEDYWSSHVEEYLLWYAEAWKAVE